MGKITGKTYPVAPNPAEFMQEEIRHTEAEITDTLHSIEAKLAPQRLKQQAKEKMVHGSVNAVVRLGYTIKRKPVPSAAVGVALLWLMRRRARARRRVRGVAVVQAPPAEVRKNPVRTFRTYLTLGRMAVAFVSVASAVLLRGKRARHALAERHYHDFEHPARL